MKNHVLIEILRKPLAAEHEVVVRWCTGCGAIVVDSEYDNRTKPGSLMKMRFPTVKPNSNT